MPFGEGMQTDMSISASFQVYPSLLALGLLTGISVPSTAQNATALPDERIPEVILQAWKNAPELVGSPSLAWTDRQIITVAFNGGDDQVRTLIEKTAEEWLDSSIPIRFSFRSADGNWRTWSRSDRF